MIRKVKYNEIDFKRYADCLDNACQNADYADKKFLDIVSNRQWFLLTYGDYDAIMPISYIRKYGFTFILMPKMCQQLGVFSKKDNPNVNREFYDFLSKNFLVLIYAFNGDNHFDFEVEKKTSYFLEKNNYQAIKKKYSSHRRRNVRMIGDLIGNVQFKNNLEEQNKQFFLKNIKGTAKEKDREDYFEIFTKLLNKKIGSLIILEYKNEVQSLVYLYQGKQSHYLNLFINGYPLVDPNFPSIMIDHCLQKYIEQKNFDFMGSEVENVANFNQRFGAISYQYAVLTNTKLDLVKSLIKKVGRI